MPIAERGLGALLARKLGLTSLNFRSLVETLEFVAKWRARERGLDTIGVPKREILPHEEVDTQVAKHQKTGGGSVVVKDEQVLGSASGPSSRIPRSFPVPSSAPVRVQRSVPDPPEYGSGYLLM